MTDYLIIAFSFTVANFSIILRAGKVKTAWEFFLLCLYAPVCGLGWPLFLGFLLRDVATHCQKP